MKEAVALILDANESMATMYEDSRSRFECAQQVCLDMISDLMIRSKTHEVAVFVLKSPLTNHHFWQPDESTEADDDEDVPFPNILEVGGDGILPGIQRAHPNLLRRIQGLQVSSSSSSSQFRGDFCDGIVLAADALFKRTATKKYQRKIVLITDAEHKVKVDPQQLLVVLDSLRAMECRLEVIGIDFESHGEFERAASSVQSTTAGEDFQTAVHEKQVSGSRSQGDDNDSGSETDLSDDDMKEDDEDDKKVIKHQNEKLLLSLTEKTGGFVMAAKELGPILQKMLGQRLPRSTRRKVQFQIAPGLTLDARFSLLLSKASVPTLKKRVVELEEGERPDNPNAKVVKDKNGKEKVHEFSTLITHWDPEQETKEIEDIAHGFRYGSDVVPMSGYDMTGLLHTSPVKLTILGYLPETSVPKYLRVGPPYALAGADSMKTCAAIAALAVGLEKLSQVGIATLVKTKDADPILVGLFPYNSQNESSPRHLCMMQLPFRGDVINLDLEPLPEPEKDPSSEKRKAVENLIDSMILPTGVLDHARIANPLLRSFHQSVVQRILEPTCPVVSVRTENNDPMATPPEVLEKSKPAVASFQAAFPLSRAKMEEKGPRGKKGRGKKEAKTYRDYLEE